MFKVKTIGLYNFIDESYVHPPAVYILPIYMLVCMHCLNVLYLLCDIYLELYTT